MSGWIKLEKDLLTDPRLVKAALEIEARFQTMLGEMTTEVGEFANVAPLPGVTLLVGGLARLWMIADTHIGEDDILGLSADQVDKLLGIKGFCQIMPNEWLQVLDGNRVKLPNYHTHNGTTAKERSSNAERQSRYRQRVTAKRYASINKSNAVTLPDQDLDQDLDKTKIKNGEGKHAARARTAKRIPDDFELTESRRLIAKGEGVDPEREFQKFRDHWLSAAGATARKHDWDATWRNWCRKAQDFRPNGRGPPVAPTLTWRPPDDDPEYGAPEDVPARS